MDPRLWTQIRTWNTQRRNQEFNLQVASTFLETRPEGLIFLQHHEIKKTPASINFALWQTVVNEVVENRIWKCPSKSHTAVTPQSTAVRGNILISTGSNSCSNVSLLQEAQQTLWPYYIFITLMQHSNKIKPETRYTYVHWNSCVFIMTLLAGDRLCCVTIPDFLYY